MSTKLILAAVLVCTAGVLPAAAQSSADRATVQMRDGTKAEGRIEELAEGVLYLRTPQNEQLRIAIGRIALIDRKGGASGLPDTEIREARGTAHLLLLTSGSSAKGQLMQIVGGEGSSVVGPRTYLFRATDGGEHSYTADQVARIYLGTYPFDATATTAAAPPAVTPAPGVKVPAKEAWVSAGIVVRQGEKVTFSTTGEVRLSADPADLAHSTGATRYTALAPMPYTNTGALIGRIGMNGQPFGIGDQTMLTMPEAGMLYLGVNDYERSDNDGEFIVVVNGSPK